MKLSFNLCELVLVELFSRINQGYKQRRGDQIQKVINGEIEIPEVVYQEIETYIKNKVSNRRGKFLLKKELQDIKENGFECKKGLYNREFKKLFLSRYSNGTRRVDEVRFKAYVFEELAEKDLYDFSIEEAEEFLDSLYSESRRCNQNQVSRLGKYLEFAIEQGVSLNKVNYYKELANKWKK